MSSTTSPRSLPNPRRCAAMTGADKEQCDKEEATKTEGPAAREAAGSSEGSSK